MELHFLKAEDPLTKQYTRNDDGSYDKKPYPGLQLEGPDLHPSWETVA